MSFGKILDEMMWRKGTNPHREAVRHGTRGEKRRSPSTIWVTLERLRDGNRRSARYETLMRILNLGDVPTDEALLVIGGNLFGIVEAEVERFAIYLWYALLSPEERDERVAAAVAASGMRREDLYERLRTNKYDYDQSLALFISMTLGESTRPVVREGETVERARGREAAIAEGLARLRARVADTLIRSVTIDRRDGSFRVAWSDGMAQLLRDRGVGTVDIGFYRIDGSGMTLRAESRPDDRDHRRENREIATDLRSS